MRLAEITKLMRPFVIVALVSTSMYLFIVGKIDAREIIAPTGMVISFLFGERSALKKAGDSEQ